jgi:deoxyribonuclease V
VAGVDVAYVRDVSVGAVAVLKYETLDLLESKTALCKTRIPYIPTLLSFREVWPITSSINKLENQPDVFLVMGKPTIGVAKKRLFGEVGNDKLDKDAIFLKHDGEIVGAVVKTRTGSKPIYVSVGHMISLRTAIRIVKECTRHHRLPEPLLKAHEIATDEKRKIHIASENTSKE